MRDVTNNPYSADEERAREYLKTLADNTGSEDDPIGYLIASHRLYVKKVEDAIKGIVEARRMLQEYRRDFFR